MRWPIFATFILFVGLAQSHPMVEEDLSTSEKEEPVPIENNEIDGVVTLGSPSTDDSESSQSEKSEKNSTVVDSLSAMSDEIRKVLQALNLTASSFSFGGSSGGGGGGGGSGEGGKKSGGDAVASDSNVPWANQGGGGYPGGPFHGPLLPPGFGLNELFHGIGIGGGGGHGHGGLKFGGPHNDIFTQFVRFLSTIPNFKISFLRPLILGFTNTVAHSIHGAASVTAHVSHHIPAIADVKGDVLRNLISTFGHVTGSVVYVLSELITSAAAAKMTFTAHTLPHIFDAVDGVGQGVATTVATIAQVVSDTARAILSGVIAAAKVKGSIVGSIVESGKQLKNGKLEVIKSVHPHHNKQKAKTSPGGGSYGPPPPPPPPPPSVVGHPKPPQSGYGIPGGLHDLHSPPPQSQPPQHGGYGPPGGPLGHPLHLR